MAHSLTTDSFFTALRRLVSKGDAVVHTFLITGTNIVGQEKVLKESVQNWNHGQIASFYVGGK